MANSSYNGRFADRDLFMRYQYGMAVGHRYMRKLDPARRTTIPSIPTDFDFNMSFPEAGRADGEEVTNDGIYVEPPSDDSDDEDEGDRHDF